MYNKGAHGASTISYFWTDGNNKEFQSFYQKTEEYYSKIVGGLENRKGFVPYNLSDIIESFDKVSKFNRNIKPESILNKCIKS